MGERGSHVPSQELILPGENDPSGHDVAVANEIPKPALLSDFKKSLLASQDAKHRQNIVHADFEPAPTIDRTFIYPLICIEDFPTLPSQDQIELFSEAFFSSRGSHVFLRALPMVHPLRDSTVPPLRLAIACLGSIQLRYPKSIARSLFLAGFNLWAVMIETDNREARSIEMLLAILLLGIYSVTTTDLYNRPNMALLISSSGTIARRMRLHDPAQIQPSLGAQEVASRGSLMWCLWLNDLLNALHFDSAVHSFSSRELWTTMPAGTYEFQDIYRICVNPNEIKQALPIDMTSPDDALLLLMAFLSDLLYFRRAFSMVSEGSARLNPHQKFPNNPFASLTPRTELGRLHETLRSALDTWAQRFQSFMAPEVMSFYYYCRLHLVCPELLDFPRLAHYSAFARTATDFYNGQSVSDVAVHLAWSILDHAAKRSKVSAAEELCPIWLPICVFHAALVVWMQQTFSVTHSFREQGSRIMLLAFKIELGEMPWPCCADMVSTLERLMDHSTANY